MDDVLLVGYGAVGIVYAHIILKSEARLTVVARSNFEAAKNGQISMVSGVFGTVESITPQRVCRTVAEAADRAYIFVLVCSKALPDVLPTSKLLEPLLKASYSYPQPTYALLQNGLGIETDLYTALKERRPSEPPRIITCGVWCITNLVGNVVKHTALTKLEIGLYDPSRTTAIQDPSGVIDSFRALMELGGAEIVIPANVQAKKFYKNIWNITYAMFACLARVPTAFFTANDDVWERTVPMFLEVSRECLAVGRALGFTEEELPANTPEALNTLCRATLKDPKEGGKVSTLLDIEASKPFELEVIVGEVLRDGKRLGVPTPRIEAIYTTLSVTQAFFLKSQK